MSLLSPLLLLLQDRDWRSEVSAHNIDSSFPAACCVLPICPEIIKRFTQSTESITVVKDQQAFLMHSPILMAAATNSAFDSAMIKQSTKTITSSISTACAQLERHLIGCQACVHFGPMRIFHLKHTISRNDGTPILSYISTCNVFNIGRQCFCKPITWETCIWYIKKYHYKSSECWTGWKERQLDQISLAALCDCSVCSV